MYVGICKVVGHHSSGGEATGEEGLATEPEHVTYAPLTDFYFMLYTHTVLYVMYSATCY